MLISTMVHFTLLLASQQSTTQQIFICSKSAIVTPEKDVKHVQSEAPERHLFLVLFDFEQVNVC